MKSEHTPAPCLLVFKTRLKRYLLPLSFKKMTENNWSLGDSNP